MATAALLSTVDHAAGIPRVMPRTAAELAVLEEQLHGRAADAARGAERWFGVYRTMRLGSLRSNAGLGNAQSAAEIANAIVLRVRARLSDVRVGEIVVSDSPDRLADLCVFAVPGVALPLVLVRNARGRAALDTLEAEVTMDRVPAAALAAAKEFAR